VCVGGQADGRRSVSKPRGTSQVKSSQDVRKQQHHAPNICPAYLPSQPASQTHTRSRPRMHSLAPARRATGRTHSHSHSHSHSNPTKSNPNLFLSTTNIIFPNLTPPYNVNTETTSPHSRQKPRGPPQTSNLDRPCHASSVLASARARFAGPARPAK
jgi:hypothetical protein